MSKIELITHPYPIDVRRSRMDYAKITGQDLIERPYWFRNTVTGQLYYDLYACLGWPSEVTDSDDGLPGYAAIIGVVRPIDSHPETNNPCGAKFQLLAEAESKDVPLLLGKCLDLRKQYGFGIQKNLLRVWLGDPDRFLTTLALLNEVLIKDGEVNAILMSPPDDFYTLKVFDNYVRALKSTLLKPKRFFFGHNDILKNRIREFKRDDPCVMAVGGLAHSLLCRTTWMDQGQESVFTVNEDS